jgi:hypothetical protein
MCTAICKSILYRMDKCAIQINRMSQCARKTTAAAIIIGVPCGSFTGASIAITSLIPADDKDARWAVLYTSMLGMIGTVAMLAWRYLWLFQRTGSGSTFCLPESHAALLEAEVANPNLPEAYRDECRQYLATMDARAEEFQLIEHSVEHPGSET